MKVFVRMWSDGYDITFIKGIYSSHDLAKSEELGCYVDEWEVNGDTGILSALESRARTILGFPNLNPCIEKLLRQGLAEGE